MYNKALPQVLYENKARGVTEMLIEHEAKLSALFFI